MLSYQQHQWKGYYVNMKEILIATANAHKVDEYRQMLQPYGYTVKSLADFDFEEVEETGTTFAQNALIKAKALYNQVKMRVIADDSGLEIKALNNQPGIYSARYLGVNTPYKEKNELIIEQLKDKDDRRACFICAIALVDDNEEKVFIGEFWGTIAYQAKGLNGFGYDPIFYLEEYQKTAAELIPEVKNEISHRGKAMKQLLPYLLAKDKI